MSNQTNFTQSRRNFLKGAAYTSALSLGGLPSFALANNHTKEASLDSIVPLSENGISVMCQNMLDKDTISLINNTDESVMLDALHPVTIENVNGSLLVKPNLVKSKSFCGMVMVLPRERISFDITSIKDDLGSAETVAGRNSADKHLEISSTHSAFNRIIPVSNAHASIA